MSITVHDSKSYSVNASEAPAPPPPEKPWWEQEYFGIPLWVYIVAGVGLGLVGIGMVVVRK
jgi:hypothetical protein